MRLFSNAKLDVIKQAAEKSKQSLEPVKSSAKSKSINSELQEISKDVQEYFKDSPAILINDKIALHEYISKIIDFGYAAVDCETTGLDRVKDHVVGFSLYVPGMPECYIPNKHLVPIFDEPYKNQLTYEECAEELQRIADSTVRLIYANADFDLSMMRKDFKVDLSKNFYYDVILGWRCLKEDEKDNRLKPLYNKHVLHGKGDPKTFSDFFPVKLFPYCKPEIAKLYAAHDAKITFDEFKWQLPYTDKTNNKCKKNHLEAIADLIWNVEMPLVWICHKMHHTGVYIDKEVASVIQIRYQTAYQSALSELRSMVQEIIEQSDYRPGIGTKVPFASGKDFNPDSVPQVKHLLYTLMKLPAGESKGTGKDVLADINLPVTNQLLKVRSLRTLIGTFTDKLPKSTTPDGRIHAQFKQIGAATGRFSSAEPNLQNIPSHATDIRHMFRATPSYIKTVSCQVVDDRVSISLPRYNLLLLSDGNYKTVSDLHTLDSVQLLHNGLPETLCVCSICNNVDDTSLRDIQLNFSEEHAILDGDWTATVKTPPYVMLSSDYSAQEPRLTAYVANEQKMIDAFVHGRDVYATIASVAFEVPYEACLEFHPDTGEYQPDGKARRSEAKTILLGITYGRSLPSVADQLYGKDKTMSDEQKLKKAQVVFDSVMKAFPGLRDLMNYSQQFAKEHGYVETILGRRRHLPDMQLPEFEFKAMKGYVNPDIDPLDLSTLSNKSEIPERIQSQLLKEFRSYKYFGQIVKRTKELAAEHIKVVNNRHKINDATRQCVNCVDDETEILTVSGWKHEKDVRIGESCLGFDVEKQEVVVTKIVDKHVYTDGDGIQVYEFDSSTFNSVSTPDHRWVVGESGEKARFKTSSNIWKNKWPDYPILRVADNQLPARNFLVDEYLQLLGWIMTDGYFCKLHYGIELYQSTKNEKNACIYHKMLDTLHKLGFEFLDNCSDGVYHTIYLKKNDMLYDLWKHNTDRTLTFEFVSTLSQHQAQILMWSMIEGDGTLGNGKDSTVTFICSNTARRDVFQYLAFIAGYATNAYEISAEDANRWSKNKLYDSISNKEPIVTRNNYWSITVLRTKRAHIYPNHKSDKIVNKVWCVTTTADTWVMRRNGKVSITGNSRIQGSAADQTKLAMLMLENSEEWKRLGGRLILPVHDELIAEVPMDNYEEGGKVLSDLMCKAAEFLPFPSKCDVETTLRWYGLPYPCPFTKPESLDDTSENAISWIQYCILECEYLLPVYKNPDGSKPNGIASRGCNGKDSPELRECINDYCTKHRISMNEFLNHIENKVFYGQ